MKKIIIFAIGLSVMLLFVACNQGDNSVTLESMKKTLTDAGYTINEDYAENYAADENLENSIGGFSFIFPGAHGNVNTPVCC